MRKLLTAILLLSLTAPVLGCIAIPWRPDQRPTSMKLTEQRALIYARDGREHLILSVQYAGATSQFAWVIPTETRPQVDVQKGAPFHELWRLTEIRQPMPAAAPGGGSRAETAARPPVTVVERKVAGPYELIVLQATSGGGLYDWLERNGFKLTPEARGALDDYVKRNFYFAAARMRPGGAANQKLQENLRNGVIAALHLSFAARSLTYPLRVTAGNPGDSRMEIYVVGQQVRRPRLLQALQFQLKPSVPSGFAVQGPPGLAYPQGSYPALRALLPNGGTLYKFTGVMSSAQRSQDLVFAPIPKVAIR